MAVSRPPSGGVRRRRGPSWSTGTGSYPISLSPDLVTPAAEQGRFTAVLAEEWHTAYSSCQVSDRLWAGGLREKALMLWNANNVMGFDRIDWARLAYCTQITTVSKYMKHVMWARGVNPLVIPNGIPAERIQTADPTLVVRNARRAFPGRELVFKIGRFSPDKRWLMAIEALATRRSADMTSRPSFAAVWNRMGMRYSTTLVLWAYP